MVGFFGGNYWNNLQVRLKIIFGYWFLFPSFKLDISPAQEPYDIPGMT